VGRTPGLWLAVVTLAPCAALADPAPDESFGAVLDRKGLKRFGQTYILKDTEDRDRQAKEYAEAIEAIVEQYKPILDERARLAKALADAEKAEKDARERLKDAEDDRYRVKDSGKSKEDQLEKQKAERDVALARGNLSRAEEARRIAQAQRDDYEARTRDEVARYERERGRFDAAARKLVAETLDVYRTLSTDPEVRAAIRAHNRDRRPKVVLGAVASREEYLKVLRDDDVALLRERGVVWNPKAKRYVLAAEAAVGTKAFVARKRSDELRAAERRGPVTGKDRRQQLTELRQAVAKSPVGTARERRRRDDALQKLDAQIAALPPPDNDPGAPARAHRAEVVKARLEFLTALGDLFAAAEDAAAARRKVDADGEVQDSLAELLGGSRPGARRTAKAFEPFEYRRGLADLKALERLVRQETLPATPGAAGAAGALRTEVVINGAEPVAVRLDPAHPTTVLPAWLAARAGARPPESAAETRVVLDDGQTVIARRAVLRTLKVGSLTAEDVDCFVAVADAAPSDAPVLGADLLAHFGARVNKDRELVLMRPAGPAPAPPREAAGAAK
jgi:hypothetical protein